MFDLKQYHAEVDARIAALPFPADKRYPADRRGSLNCNMGAGKNLRAARAARGLDPLTGLRPRFIDVIVHTPSGGEDWYDGTQPFLRTRRIP